MMRAHKLLPPLLLATLAAPLMSGCSGSAEAPQVSFCKTLSSEMSGMPQAVQNFTVENRMARFEDLEVKLSFDVVVTADTTQKINASCFYRYDTAKEEGMVGPDLMQVYETAPYRMHFNDREVPKDILVSAVKEGMFVQAEANLKAIQDSVQEAAEKVRETAESYR